MSTKHRATEHGLLMSGPMALAAYRGIKTQTRRPLKLTGAKAADLELSTYTEDGADFIWRMNPSDESPYVAIKCPYGRVGDRVYVREAWTSAYSYGRWGTMFRADGAFVQGKQRHETGPHFDGEREKPLEQPWIKWRPSLHLPKWASRTWGTITGVRVERVQGIGAAGILAEGAVARGHNDSVLGRCPVSAFDGRCYVDLISLWAAGWNSLYTGELSWAANPWVWVVEWRLDR